jgi:rhodanese-related sulfurtransferase
MSLRDLFHRGGSIDVAEAARLLETGDLVLVDVRESAEWRSGRVPGAQHVPLSGLARGVDALAREENQVAFICRSGHRSGAACAAERSRGLDALNVRGGMRAWQRAGLAVTKD